LKKITRSRAEKSGNAGLSCGNTWGKQGATWQGLSYTAKRERQYMGDQKEANNVEIPLAGFESELTKNSVTPTRKVTVQKEWGDAWCELKGERGQIVPESGNFLHTWESPWACGKPLRRRRGGHGRKEKGEASLLGGGGTKNLDL